MAEDREAPVQGDEYGLLERSQEVEAIEADVAAVAGRSGGRALMITGPPGIGKTSLLAAARRRSLEVGMTVLDARGGPLERDLPHAIVRRLLERAARDSGEQVYRGFAGLARPLFDPIGSGGRRSPLPDRDELCHAIYWMLINLAAARPLALLVDDAHDGDDASLAVIAYLASRIEPVDVLLVIASRTASSPIPALAAVADVAGPGGCLEPVELTRDGVRLALERKLGKPPDTDLAHACFKASEGNPELVEMLAGEAASEGMGADDLEMLAPATVMKAALERLNLLGPDERAVAEAAAILEAQSTVPRLAAITGLDAPQVSDSLARLEAARLMTPGLPPAFTHPTIAESVADQISAARRSLLHQQAADLLGDEGLPADVCALHLLHTEPAGDHTRVELLIEAGISSRRSAAPEVAIRCLERALREPPPASRRTRVLTELGRAELRIGDPVGIGTLRTAFDEETEPLGRAKIARHLADGLIRFERWSEGASVLAAARAELGERDGGLASDLEASALVAAWTGGEAAGRDERIARVASRLGDAAGPVRARALSTMTWIAATEGRDAARVRELAGEMVALSAARETGDPAAIMASLMAIAALGAVDEHDSAWAAIELMQAHAEEHAPYARPIVAALAMFHLWRRGHYAEALTYESPVAPLGPGHLAIAPLAAVLVQSDRLDEAGRLTPSREPVDTSAPLPLGWELVEFARGRRHSERGEHAEAAAAFELAGQLHLRHGIQGSSLISWRSQAGLALLRAGDADRGARLILDEVEVAERYGARARSASPEQPRACCAVARRGSRCSRRRKNCSPRPGSRASRQMRSTSSVP